MSSETALALSPVPSIFHPPRGILRCSSLSHLAVYTPVKDHLLRPSTSSAACSPKLVRFRLPLTETCTFDEAQSPVSLSSSGSDSSPISSSCPRSLSLHETACPGRSRYAFDVESYTPLKENEPYAPLSFFDSPDCSPPGSTRVSTTINSHNVPEQPRDQTVSAYSLHLSSCLLKPMLYGYIRCANLAYEKTLRIKFSTDSWRSSIMISSVAFVRAYDPSYDIFRFTLPLSQFVDHDAEKTALSIDMCVQYLTAGAEYWDNNRGRNFQITLTSSLLNDCAKSRTVSDPAPPPLSTQKHKQSSLSSQPLPTRPYMKSSFSANDLRYCTHVPALSKTATSPVSGHAESPLTGRLSYSDIVANYCFSSASAGSGVFLESCGVQDPFTANTPPPRALSSLFGSAHDCSFSFLNSHSGMHPHEGDALFI